MDLPVPSSDSLTLIDVSFVTREMLASRVPLLPFAAGVLPAAASTGGIRSSSSARPGFSTTEAPTCSSALPMAVGVCSSTDLANTCGVSTPYAIVPALRPAMMSSTVSPTMAACSAPTPSALSASRMGSGDGLGGQSSMQICTGNRSSMPCARRNLAQSLRGRPVTTAMPLGRRRCSSRSRPLGVSSVSSSHRPAVVPTPW